MGVINFTALAALSPGRNLGTHRMGGWVGHGAVWTVLERENLLPLPWFEPRVVASRYTDCSVPIPSKFTLSKFLPISDRAV